MNEAETRAEYIGPALAAAGWGVVEGSRVLHEHCITLGRLQGGGPRTKADIADYVLVYRNTKLVVIEAKALHKPLTEGVGQAKRYAAKLALRFTYASNGPAIYGTDMATGAEGEFAHYPSPDELWALTFATGTGKTFIAFQLAWKLFQSRWNLGDWHSNAAPTRRPRILFLADRNILAGQAYNAFSAFPANQTL